MTRVSDGIASSSSPMINNVNRRRVHDTVLTTRPMEMDLVLTIPLDTKLSQRLGSTLASIDIANYIPMSTVLEI